MNYLIVVAHPDDEVLGAGATMYKLSTEGHRVTVCILSGAVEARMHRPEVNDLHDDLSTSMKILGVQSVILGEFPNIEFNTVAHLKLVQFIEEAIIKSEADVIITHHPADLNNDHLHTSLACQAALRIFQRRKDLKAPQELLLMEVPSATDWSINSALNAFRPNTYVEVFEKGIQAKLDALNAYRGIMREYPHPRSAEAIRGLAAYRGGQAGQYFSEAFESIFRRGI